MERRATDGRRHIHSEGRRWTALWLGLVIIVACAVSAGALVRWRFVGPRIGNEVAEFNQYARSLAPPGTDAWPRYESLLRMRLGYDYLDLSPMNAPTAADFQKDIGLLWQLREGSLEDATMAPALEAIDRYKDVIPELDAIAHSPAFTFQFTSTAPALANTTSLYSALYQVFNATFVGMNLAMLNAAHMRVEAQRGDWDHVSRRLITGVRFGRRIAQTPLLYTRVSGYSFESMAWNELAWILTERTPPREVIEGLLLTIEDLGDPPTIADAITGEEFGLRSFIDEHVKKERGIFHPLAPDSRERWLSTPSHHDFEWAWRDYYAAVAPIIDLPPLERDAKLPPAPPLVVDASFVGEPFDLVISSRDALLRRRAAVRILLYLNRSIAETGRIPSDPRSVVPDHARQDPLYGGEFLVEPKTDRRLPFVLHWPRKSTTDEDRVFTLRNDLERPQVTEPGESDQ